MTEQVVVESAVVDRDELQQSDEVTKLPLARRLELLAQLEPDSAFAIDGEVLDLLIRKTSEEVVPALVDHCGSKAAVYRQLVQILEQPFVTQLLFNHPPAKVAEVLTNAKHNIPELFRHQISPGFVADPFITFQLNQIGISPYSRAVLLPALEAAQQLYIQDETVRTEFQSAHQTPSDLGLRLIDTLKLGWTVGGRTSVSAIYLLREHADRIGVENMTELLADTLFPEGARLSLEVAGTLASSKYQEVLTSRERAALAKALIDSFFDKLVMDLPAVYSILDKLFRPSDLVQATSAEGSFSTFLACYNQLVKVCSSIDVRATQDALFPYLCLIDPVHQAATDAAVAVPQIRVVQQELVPDNSHYTFHYYGNDFIIADLPRGTYTASEINPGVVCVKDGQGNPVCVLNMHPYYRYVQEGYAAKKEVVAKKVEPARIFSSVLAEDRRATAAEIIHFLKEYEDFFADEGEFANRCGFEMGLNIIPVNAKFELWRTLRAADAGEKEKIYKFLRQYGAQACMIFPAFEGEKELVMALVNLGTGALGDERRVTALGDIINSVYEFEAFPTEIRAAAEGFAASLPPGPKLQKELLGLASDLQAQVRGMEREMAHTYQAQGYLSDEQMGYFLASFNALSTSYHLISQLRRGEQARKVEVPVDLLDEARRIQAGLAGGTETYRALVLYYTAQSIANQQGLSYQDRVRIIERLYADNPELFVQASETTADTLTERERGFNGVRVCQARGLLPQAGLVYFNYGCDTGWRLDYDLLQRLKSVGRPVGRYVGFDLRQIDNRALQMEFVQTDIAYIPGDYFGQADLGKEDWSSTYDQNLLLLHEQMFLRMAQTLKRPNKPLPIAAARKVTPAQVNQWLKEGNTDHIGGVLMLDRAIPWGPYSHKPAVEAYHRKYPLSAPGQKAPLLEYMGAFVGEPEETPDSLVDSLNRWMERLKEIGVVVINFPHQADEIDGLRRLVEEGPEEGADYTDPWKTPLWFTQNKMLRCTAIAVLVSDPKLTTDPEFRRHLWSPPSLQTGRLLFPLVGGEHPASKHNFGPIPPAFTRGVLLVL